MDLEGGRAYNTWHMADHGHLRWRLGFDFDQGDVNRRRFGLLTAALVVVSVGVAIVWVARSSLGGQVRTIAAPVTAGKCHSVDGLPDPKCTPGVTDPRVTQSNIQTTICVTGYTAKVRPSSVYTRLLKQRQIAEYGYADTNPADYEEDHLIPLELGGSPTDPKNLWPEPVGEDHPASRKDGIENSLHNKVCSGVTSLADAQTRIATNWQAA